MAADARTRVIGPGPDSHCDTLTPADQLAAAIGAAFGPLFRSAEQMAEALAAALAPLGPAMHQALTRPGLLDRDGVPSHQPRRAATGDPCGDTTPLEPPRE